MLFKAAAESMQERTMKKVLSPAQHEEGIRWAGCGSVQGVWPGQVGQACSNCRPLQRHDAARAHQSLRPG